MNERKWGETRIDDEDTLYFIEELVHSAIRIAPMLNVPAEWEETVTVCKVCDGVDGCQPGCPIDTLKKVWEFNNPKEVPDGTPNTETA